MERLLQVERDIDVDKRIICFIGVEGSGKTTVAKAISARVNKPYVSTGDIFRYMAANDSGVLGQKCRDMFENHSYMDGATLLQIYEERLKSDEFKDGFILDGGLRTVEETSGFWGMLQRANRNMPLVVVHLRTPGWMAADRLIGENGRGRNDDTVEGVL